MLKKRNLGKLLDLFLFFVNHVILILIQTKQFI